MNCPVCHVEFEQAIFNHKYCSPECRLYRSRSCLICMARIPLRAIVDGFERNLQNRKKCLVCLPWNPRKILTAEERISANKIKCGSYYQKNKVRENKKTAKRVTALTIARKQAIIDLVGGCQVCGYNKNLRNIAFHHLRDKKFNLSGNVFSHSREKLAEKLAKCICVCHMCHGDAHDNLLEEELTLRLNVEFKQAVSIWVGKT